MNINKIALNVLEEECNKKCPHGIDCDDDDLDEKKIKKVVRGNKIVKKVVCKDGFKAKGKKCVKIKAAERINKKKGSRKMVRSKKGKSLNLANKKRAKSMKKANRLSK